jgi:hypothetical protein
LTALRREEIKTLAVDYMTDNWKYVRFMTFAENEALLNYIVDTGVNLCIYTDEYVYMCVDVYIYIYIYMCIYIDRWIDR